MIKLDNMFTYPKHFLFLTRLIIVCSCILILSTNIYSQSASQPSDVVHQFFKAMHAKDSTGLASIFHPDATLQSYNIMTNKPINIEKASTKALINSIAKTPAALQIEEKLLSVTQLAESHMAIVWAPYNLKVDNKSLWCGTNLFTLIFFQNSWQIISIIDTRKDCID